MSQNKGCECILTIIYAFHNNPIYFTSRLSFYLIVFLFISLEITALFPFNVPQIIHFDHHEMTFSRALKLLITLKHES